MTSDHAVDIVYGVQGLPCSPLYFENRGDYRGQIIFV